jgi:tRNA(Ile)-lysidine synthase
MAIKERQEIIILKKGGNVRTEELLPKEGSIVVDGYTLHIEETVFNGEIPKSADTASLDLETLQMPLRIRNIKAGDRFIPFGMRGSKLISDYLTDRKRSLYEKRCQLVMTDAAGQIIWLIGERTASVAAVSDATRYVLTIECQ